VQNKNWVLRLDPYGVAAEWVTSALNGSVYTYEVAPVFTLMELEVFERMRNIIGFPKNQGDGLFCPGGSIANGYAISVARFKKRPEIKVILICCIFHYKSCWYLNIDSKLIGLIKERGLCGMKPMVMFVSEDAHYSFKKLASFQGQ